MSGLVSGLGDFIKANAPGAVNIPTAAYEHYFIDHWAKDTEYEAKHRELTKSIGESIRGKPILSSGTLYLIINPTASPSIRLSAGSLSTSYQILEFE